MSIAHLPGGRRGASPVTEPPARARLTRLITQLADDRLDVAEELLADIVSHQQADTRGLTTSELSVLERLGVDRQALESPSSLAATAKSRLWERQIGGLSLSVSETASMLGVTAARVRQRCAGGTLLAQRRSDGWHLPEFQFPNGRELPGWSTVAAAVPAGAPLLLVERVLTSPVPSLRIDGEAVAPFEWLAQRGDPVAAATAVDDALNRLP